MKTELNDRTLWFDGTSEVDPDLVADLLLLELPVDRIAVRRMSEDVELFNDLQDGESSVKIAVGKAANDSLSLDWNIPAEYLSINLAEYIINKLTEKDLDTFKYHERAADELEEIARRGLTPVFQTLIYIVDQLRAKKQVWGVGRGSSCASLVLYLLDIHAVDPVEFNIPASEFFHD